MGGEAKLEDLSVIGLASRGGDLLGINNVCWFLVGDSATVRGSGKVFLDKVWGDEFPDELIWNRGGAKFGVIGLTNGKSYNAGGISCQFIQGKIVVTMPGEEKLDLSSRSGSRNVSEKKLAYGYDYSKLTKIALKPSKETTLVFSNNPEKDGLKQTDKEGAKSIMLCIGGEGQGNWGKRETVESWYGKTIAAKYGKRDGKIECRDPKGEEELEVTDGKKFNELA